MVVAVRATARPTAGLLHIPPSGVYTKSRVWVCCWKGTPVTQQTLLSQGYSESEVSSTVLPMSELQASLAQDAPTNVG
jgi:hypothetical protein